MCESACFTERVLSRKFTFEALLLRRVAQWLSLRESGGKVTEHATRGKEEDCIFPLFFCQQKIKQKTVHNVKVRSLEYIF